MKYWNPPESFWKATAYWLREKKFGGLVEASLVSTISIFSKKDWTRVHYSSRVKDTSYSAKSPENNKYYT